MEARNINELYLSFKHKADYLGKKWKRKASFLRTIVVSFNILIILLGFLIGFLTLKELTELTSYLISVFGFISAFIKSLSVILNLERKSIVLKESSIICSSLLRNLELKISSENKDENNKRIMVLNFFSKLDSLEKNVFNMELGRSFNKENKTENV